MKRTKTRKTTVQVEEPVFKLKITNLRTAAYPRPLEQTDYLNIKVGDYLTKGSENTVYQVVKLQRESITEAEFTRWKQRLLNTAKKANDLIDEYKKNGNFGACYVSIRPVIRGQKEVAKGRLVRFNEIEQIYGITYRNFYKVSTLEELINNRIANISAIDWNLNKWQRKKNIQVNAKNVLESVLSKNKANSMPNP